ncbi:helix-turn-helix domain-containing protein [Saccharopolyspora rhizosphaerae]|uniref:helix-turn-helix domain-containing protein n=1 Tax=Saccharopolyspora rhizosphaerae TaxID=2492662 RepID=UPI0013152078|nr:helix-turn-helix domain-containing protein [Saccharopolyspora rhizosphaerae]
MTLRTDTVPDPRDRHEYLRQIVRDTVVPLNLHQERSKVNHWGEVIRTDLPCGSVARMSAYPTHIERTPRLIREADPDLCQVQMHLEGTNQITEGDERAQIGPGEVVVFDPHEPFDAAVGHPVPGQASDGIARVVNLMLPRPMLDLRGPRDRITQARLSCRNPMNSLAASAMAELDRQHLAGNTDLVVHLTSVIADLLSFGLAHQLESLSAVTPETRENALLWSVRRFIEEHLADPSLTTRTVAEAHNVAPRTLQRLFQREGTSVVDHIRDRRLDRCRRDLLDPSQRGKPVAAIAFRWGFRDESHFSRRFRDRYGAPPGAYRDAAERSVANGHPPGANGQ